MYPGYNAARISREAERILADRGAAGRNAQVTERWVNYIMKTPHIQNPADTQADIPPSVVEGDGIHSCSRHPNYDPTKKPKTDCPVCQILYEMESIRGRNQFLQRQLEQVISKTPGKAVISGDARVRIGFVTDTHLGSLFDDLEALNTAYKIFEQEGITTVLHAGDICDGEKMFRGHEYEIKIHGADNQVSYTVENYPAIPGITTQFITGNHDLSFYKHAGIDIGSQIAARRNDMVYLGQDEADVTFLSGRGSCKVRLNHPGGGSAYATSYKIQKYIESLTGGEKPNIVLTGHYHKSEMLPSYRNICAVQGGTLQYQTRFMRSKNLAAHKGFWIIEFNIDSDNMISRFRGEFYALYA